MWESIWLRASSDEIKSKNLLSERGDKCRLNVACSLSAIYRFATYGDVTTFCLKPRARHPIQFKGHQVVMQ